MSVSTTFDVIVIGAGSAGLTAAVGCAKVGKRVLLIEREHIGGECTNSGCIPSKALIHHAKAFYHAKEIAGETTATDAFRQQAFTYVRSIIATILREETPEHFAKQGITVIMGEAIFTSPRSVRVDETTYTFSRAIIATGSSPRHIEIPGLNPETVLTNQNLFQLESIPKRLLIIGGGPIGLEMGQALAMLGSQVTIADTGEEFAKLEDRAVSAVLAETFHALGVRIELGAHVQAVENGCAVFNRLHQGTTTSFTIPFDNLLMAIGRVPNLPAGLEVAGIAHTPQGISVTHNWRTTNRFVYALGDVAARLKFTHVADDTGRQVVAHIVSRGIIPVREKTVPKVTYTEPQVAQVGMSWDEAVEAYGVDRLHRLEVPFTTNDRARTDNASSGVLVVIAKRLSGKVLGAHLIGPQAGELITVFTLAIDRKISLWTLRATIFAYPTYSLIIKKAGDYFFTAQIASLKTDLIAAFVRLTPKLFFVALWLTLLYTLYDYQQTFGFTTTELALKLFDFITATIWGPFLYIAAYTIRPLTFFPGTALTILSGVFFGLWGGIIYTIIGANLSAALAYMVGRYVGGNLTLEKTAIGSWVTALRERPFVTILTMRLIFLPFDVINYGAGVLKLPFLPYLLATIVGTLLGIATFVSIGASLSVAELTENGFSVSAIDSTFLLLSIVIFIASLGVARFLKQK